MALATTCPHCKTSFKVVADQLKLRRGLVRCGKCQEVFSGVDYLRYIDDPAPRPAQPGTPGPKVFAGPVQGMSNQGAETDDATVTPREASLDDLKTAFFLPETVFNASVMVDPVTIQAPVPVYIPSPMVAPSSRHAEPAPTGPASPVPAPGLAGPALAHPDEVKPDSQAFLAGSTTSPAHSQTDSPAATTGNADEHERSAFDPTDESLSVRDLERDATPKSDAGDSLLPGSEPGSEPDDEQPGNRVERAALKLSRLPDGVDLAGSLSRPARIIKPALADEVPANGAHFATGLEDRDHLAEETRPQVQGEQAIDFGARPRQPGARLWPALAAVLVLLALLQGLVAMRNEIAVQVPELKPVLASLVEPLGLKLELPRRYDAVTIESFELQATEVAAGDVQSYYAQALLRNHAGYAVQWPAIELSLTDPNGQLLARKVLLAADYLGTTEPREQGFAPKSERTVRIRLGLNQITPNGYSAVLFYP